MPSSEHILDPNMPDPYEPYYALDRANRRLSRDGLVKNAIIAFLSLVVVFGVVLRPMPVIVTDPTSGRMPVIAMTEAAPVITTNEARAFFGHMLQLRFGWDSANIEQAFIEYLGMCEKAHRDIVVDYLHQPNEAAQEVGHAPVVRQTNLEAWGAAHVVNTLVLPEMEEVDCRPQQDDGLWHCKVRATFKQEDIGPDNRPITIFDGVFTATLLPVPHTWQTRAGLVVKSMDYRPTSKMVGVGS